MGFTRSVSASVAVAPAVPGGGTVVGVRYLTGYAAAATPGGGAEWPPHPARLFMALVAALHERGNAADERAALTWLERQDPPQVHAAECDERPVVETFVPPNDFRTPGNVDRTKDSGIAWASNVLPARRNKRQPRTFPRVRPHVDTVWFVWTAACPHAEAFGALVEGVGRLGHSASLVQVWLAKGAAAGAEADGTGVTTPRGLRRYVAEPRGTASRSLALRVPRAGQLAYLESAYREEAIDQHFMLVQAVDEAATPAKARAARQAFEKATGRAWSRGAAPPPPDRTPPVLHTAERYGVAVDLAAPQLGGSVFDAQLAMFTLSPADSAGEAVASRLPGVAGVDACRVFREAVIATADRGDGVPECISGHAARGGPTRRPHLAYLPLLGVGGRHAAGHLMGVGVALPRDLSEDDRTAVAMALSGVPDLKLGRRGVWTLEPAALSTDRAALRSASYTAAGRADACVWATVTPIALDGYPRGKTQTARDDATAALVAKACVNVGLPQPAKVRLVGRLSPFIGGPSTRGWPSLPNKAGGTRPQVHAVLRFAEPVVGPVLLGAGRFRGYGVCRPLREGGRA